MLPKMSRLLSAETESMPKVLKSTLSAQKLEPKFGRPLEIGNNCTQRNGLNEYTIQPEALELGVGGSGCLTFFKWGAGLLAFALVIALPKIVIYNLILRY